MAATSPTGFLYLRWVAYCLSPDSSPKKLSFYADYRPAHLREFYTNNTHKGGGRKTTKTKPTAEEITFIRNNVDKMTDKEMAEHLERKPSAVSRIRKAHGILRTNPITKNNLRKQ